MDTNVHPSVLNSSTPRDGGHLDAQHVLLSYGDKKLETYHLWHV